MKWDDFKWSLVCHFPFWAMLLAILIIIIAGILKTIYMKNPCVPEPSIQYGASKSKTFHEGATIDDILVYIKDNMDMDSSVTTKKYQISVKEMVPLKAKRWLKERRHHNQKGV